MNLDNLEVGKLESSPLGIEEIFPLQVREGQFKFDSIYGGVGSSNPLFKVGEISLNYELNSIPVEVNNLSTIFCESNLLGTGLAAIEGSIAGGIEGKDPFAIEGSIAGGIEGKDPFAIEGSLVGGNEGKDPFAVVGSIVGALERKEYLNNLVNESRDKSIEILARFGQKSELKENLETAFGKGKNGSEINKLIGQLASAREWPVISILSAEQMMGGKGAYSAATETIYLSAEFISNNRNSTETIAKVIVEELGHYLDSKLNREDSAGDEGAILAALVFGEELTSEKLAALKAENDRGILNLDGKKIEVEFAVDRALSNTNTLIYDPRKETEIGANNPDQFVNVGGTFVYQADPSLVNPNSNYIFTSTTAPTSQERILNIATDWRVENLGTTTETASLTNALVDGFYLSNDSILDASDIYLTTVAASGTPLAPGTSYDAATAFSVGLAATENYNYLLVATNYAQNGTNNLSNPRAEANLTNNVAAVLLAETAFTASNPYNFVDGKYATAAPLKEGGIEIHSGALTNFHATPTYESLGVARGVKLRYDSLAADPRHILHFGYSELPNLAGEQLLSAKLKIEGQAVDFEVAGATAGTNGLKGNEHFWRVTPSANPNGIDASLLVDMTPYSSGIYDYSVAANIQDYNPDPITAQFETPFFSTTGANAALDRGELIVVNHTNSEFGAGWGLAGLEELFIKNRPADPALPPSPPEIEKILLTDGDGNAIVYRDLGTRDALGGIIYEAPDDFSSLVQNADGTLTRTLKDRTVYTFTPINGRYLLTSVRDRNGNTTTHTFDAVGNLLTITDPVNLTTTFNYNAAGKVSSIVDPATKTTQLQYDPAGNLIKIINPDLSERNFQYDAFRHLTLERDERNNPETATYDPISGRAITGTHADNTQVRVNNVATNGLTPLGLTYNPFAAPTVAPLPNDSSLVPINSQIPGEADRSATARGTYRNENNNLIEADLDRFGQATITKDEVGLQTRIVRDPNQNLVSLKIDPLNTINVPKQTQLEHDANGNLIRVTEADGGVRAYEYDPTFNQLTRITDEIYNQNVTLLGRGAADTLGHQVLYEIDPLNGNVLTTTEIIGANDTLAALGDSPDLITRYTYTPQGLIDTTTDAEGRITDYNYDNKGRLTSTTFAVGTSDLATQRFEYDLAGNLLVFTDELGRQTRYEYDKMNRQTLIVEADPDGIAGSLISSPVTSLGYDRSGNLISSTDARGNLTSYAYDNRDRLITTTFEPTTDRRARIKRYEYDNKGNQTRIFDELNRQIINSYDARDRLIATTDRERNTTSFQYDLADNLIEKTDPSIDPLNPIGSKTTYAYDLRNRRIRETDAQQQSINYTYDLANNLIGIEDRNGNFTEYLFDQKFGFQASPF